MKKVLLTCLALFAFLNVASIKAADLPRLDHINMEVSPTFTGVNGTVSIQTLVQVDGTC